MTRSRRRVAVVAAVIGTQQARRQPSERASGRAGACSNSSLLTLTTVCRIYRSGCDDSVSVSRRLSQNTCPSSPPDIIIVVITDGSSSSSSHEMEDSMRQDLVIDVATALKVCKASTAIESFKSYILLQQSPYENDNIRSRDWGKNSSSGRFISSSVVCVFISVLSFSNKHEHYYFKLFLHNRNRNRLWISCVAIL